MFPKLQNTNNIKEKTDLAKVSLQSGRTSLQLSTFVMLPKQVGRIYCNFTWPTLPELSYQNNSLVAYQAQIFTCFASPQALAMPLSTCLTSKALTVPLSSQKSHALVPSDFYNFYSFPKDTNAYFILKTAFTVQFNCRTAAKKWCCQTTSAYDILICHDSDNSSHPTNNPILLRVVYKFPNNDWTWTNLTSDQYHSCRIFAENIDGLKRHCLGRATELYEYGEEKQISAVQNEKTFLRSNAFCDLGVVAAEGFAYSFIPDFVVDLLFLRNIIDAEQAETIKMGIDIAVLLFSGYYIARGVGIFTSRYLQSMRCPAFAANALGNSLTFLINSFSNLTPLGLAKNLLFFAAGRTGSFAEEKLVQTLRRARNPAPVNDARNLAPNA